MKGSEIVRVAMRAPAGLAVTLGGHSVHRARQVYLPGWAGRRSGDVYSWWGKWLGRVMGARVTMKNKLEGPMGDVIIANHMGFLDVLVLLRFFPGVFIIKDEMRGVIFFGQALQDQGHVFVKRTSAGSRKSAREGVRRVLEEGGRIIVFPEGRASPGAERRPFKPFCFYEAARQGKLVQACVIDYPPDRSAVAWDPSRQMFPQLVEIVGRPKTEISVEFLPAELIDDPEEAALRYHDLIEGRLRAAQT